MSGCLGSIWYGRAFIVAPTRQSYSTTVPRQLKMEREGLKTQNVYVICGCSEDVRGGGVAHACREVSGGRARVCGGMRTGIDADECAIIRVDEWCLFEGGAMEGGCCGCEDGRAVVLWLRRAIFPETSALTEVVSGCGRGLDAAENASDKGRTGWAPSRTTSTSVREVTRTGPYGAAP
ncbi:hypothetical protein EV421DRAFT_1908949 [Armillaria borealis]|uniref:Uncharacterized protein n=1 Tax=Armillaria borealis TaxID=47425 RepID=A0AA39J683_9AGAR|nr:hypothetical protein EV421DRAFT_1908949 [Armillaria borealis]